MIKRGTVVVLRKAVEVGKGTEIAQFTEGLVIDVNGYRAGVAVPTAETDGTEVVCGLVLDVSIYDVVERYNPQKHAGFTINGTDIMLKELLAMANKQFNQWISRYVGLYTLVDRHMTTGLFEDSDRYGILADNIGLYEEKRREYEEDFMNETGYYAPITGGVTDRYTLEVIENGR